MTHSASASTIPQGLIADLIKTALVTSFLVAAEVMLFFLLRI